MELFSIAIVSDLHIGASRARDLNPKPYEAGLEDGYLASFRKLCEDEHLQSRYLVVSGDITNAGTKKEVELAETAIPEIANALSVLPENIFWTPGNHDKSWDLINASSEPREGYKYFEESTGFFSESLARGLGSYYQDEFCIKWETDDFHLVGLNSAIDDNPDTRPHHGRVTPQSLEALTVLLQARPNNTAKPTLFLLHHHLRNYPDTASVFPDFSLLQHSGTLLNLLAEQKVDLVIHGHRHHPFLDVSLGSTGYEQTFLCAGSFSASLNMGDVISNQFHLISATEYNGAGGLSGTMRNWAYNSPFGWVKSEQNKDGIQHKLGWGKTLRLSDAKALILDALVEIGKSPVSMHEVCEKNPELGFLSNTALAAAIKELTSNTSWAYHGDLSQHKTMLYDETKI